MNKTISVNIGGLVFNLEEDGFAKLNDYLNSLKEHFGSISYGAEVISDIETRIAEQFSTKISGNTQRAIATPEVDEVLKSIGSVEDFSEPAAHTKSHTENKATAKKLYRNMDDVIVAGVASGIAAYFNIDTTLVRVVFAVTVLAGGWGILLYILLWLILPEAKTTGQKLEMKGSPVTIKQLEQTAKEKISEVKASGAGKKITRFISLVIKVFVRFILGIIGFGLTLGAVVATFALTFGAANVLFNRNSPYVDFPLASIFHGAEYFFAVLLVYVTVIIPLTFLALGGITLIRMKKPPLNGLLASVLAIVWVVAAIGTGVFAINKTPSIQATAREYQGNVETRTVNVSNFTKIDASSAYHVNISSGKEYKVEVTGHAKDLELSRQDVENDTLILDRKSRFCIFCFSSGIDVNITTPNLGSIEGSGAVSYTVGSFTGTNFNIDLSGASRADISKLTVSDIKIIMSGASRATLAGSAKTLTADLSGASRLEGFDFKVADAIVEGSGASRMEINATDTLSADISGATTIFYRGNPKITKEETSGSSRLRPE